MLHQLFPLPNSVGSYKAQTRFVLSNCLLFCVFSEAEEAKEPEQKVESPQVIDPATVERRKRLSVREKAANFDANVDKNSNLKSVDNVASSKKAATLPIDVSSQQLGNHECVVAGNCLVQVIC